MRDLEVCRKCKFLIVKEPEPVETVVNGKTVKTYTNGRYPRYLCDILVVTNRGTWRASKDPWKGASDMIYETWPKPEQCYMEFEQDVISQEHEIKLIEQLVNEQIGDNDD